MGWADMHIASLKTGSVVKFRPTGNSMNPKIKDRQLVTVRPLEPDEIPKKGDIVLCKVKGRQLLHLVRGVMGEEVCIENASGHVNGWTSQIFGIVTKVEP